KNSSRNQPTPPLTKSYPPSTSAFLLSYLHCSQPVTCPSSNQPTAPASISRVVFSLLDKDTTTLEYITHAFMTRKKGDIQTLTSLRELENIKQGKNKGFTTYMARWKEAVAALVSTLTKADLIKTLISNLHPKYQDHLKYVGLSATLG
ncbi:Stanniocalcin, partial [Bienertia sinuspersici]